ncbi:UNVERIFIED_CONTAM: hypothetical protein FKN15_012347 [Acipenser sinensis]
MTTTSDCKITRVVLHFPGSCHDSYILRQSPLEAFGREGCFGTGHLIGDSDYPLHPWLLTSVERYNEALCRSHNVIERTCRLLKMSFRCLDRSGGALQYKSSRCACIIIASCALHNIALSRDVMLPQEANIPQHPEQPVAEERHDPGDEGAGGDGSEGEEDVGAYSQGQRKHQQIIQ